MFPTETVLRRVFSTHKIISHRTTLTLQSQKEMQKS